MPNGKSGKLTKHVALPFVMTILVLMVAMMPIEVLGCGPRGLMTVAIALTSGIAGVVCAGLGLRGRFKGETTSCWWIITSMVLALPLVIVLLLAQR